MICEFCVKTEPHCHLFQYFMDIIILRSDHFNDFSTNERSLFLNVKQILTTAFRRWRIDRRFDHFCFCSLSIWHIFQVFLVLFVLFTLYRRGFLKVIIRPLRSRTIRFFCRAVSVRIPIRWCIRFLIAKEKNKVCQLLNIL